MTRSNRLSIDISADELSKKSVLEISTFFKCDPTVARFFVAWLKNNRNATTAYLKINPYVTRQSAKVLGSRMLAKVNVKDVLAANNIDYQLYVGALKEGLKANKYNPVVGKTEPDYKIRLSYIEILERMIGINKDSVLRHDRDTNDYRTPYDNTN